MADAPTGATAEPGGASDDEARRAEVHRQLSRPSSSGRVRFLVAAGAGLVVALAVAVPFVPRYGVVLGLMTTCAVYVAWSFLALRRFGGHATKAHARKEDTGAALSDIGGVVVIVANLVAVVTLLVLDRDHRTQTADGALAIGGVVLSWFLLHTLYVARYARLFYRADHSKRAGHESGEPATGEQHVPPVVGGIDFNSPGYWPTYADFTYFSFNLGMTYQVSDTSVSDPRIRRLVLHQCLLSYFFATGITATVLNLVIGLVS